MVVKGTHKCPICGMQTTFTITDLNRQICDECQEPVSIGAPVVQLRDKLIKEQQVTRLIEEGRSTFDNKGVLHSNSMNDFQRLLAINFQLINMLKETMGILSDNMLMVGENKAETEEYIKFAEDNLLAIKNKYK